MKIATFILCLSVCLSSISVGGASAGSQKCPRIYQPVCGVVASAKRIATLPNSCEADKVGATILHPGQCQGAGQARCPRNPLGQVCARNDAGEKTYDNLCWAEKNWAVFVHNGSC